MDRCPDSAWCMVCGTHVFAFKACLRETHVLKQSARVCQPNLIGMRLYELYYNAISLVEAYTHPGFARRIVEFVRASKGQARQAEAFGTASPESQTPSTR